MKTPSTRLVVWIFALITPLGCLLGLFLGRWLRFGEIAMPAEIMCIPVYMLGGALGGYFIALGRKRRGG